MISPGNVFEVKPTLSTVSIIPGIDLLEPERTDTKSGLSAEPNRLLIKASIFLIA